MDSLKKTSCWITFSRSIFMHWEFLNYSWSFISWTSLFFYLFCFQFPWLMSRQKNSSSFCFFLTYMTSWTTYFFSLTLDSIPHIYTEKLTSAKHYEKCSVDEATQEALDFPFAEVGNVCQFKVLKNHFFLLSPSVFGKKN